MTATSAPAPGDDEPARTETESLDSVLVEFDDPAIDFTPGPPSEVVLRHAPSWLREKAVAAGHLPPPPADPVALADCLLGQARVLAKQGDFPHALPKVEEAVGLYRQAGRASKLADGLHVAAEVHEALGNPARATELFRLEAEIRRRPAA